MERNLHVHLKAARALAAELAANAATPIHASYLPGEDLPGAGAFITALNGAIDSLANRARAQCAYVDNAVTITMTHLRQAEATDTALGRSLDLL
ncbi:MAG: hypothetical protein Q4D85_02995 [Corynebacterium sp.]|uniref:hypothetical protein n=1 Tax=Corynebacterium sp. TaxID=1720 RepID=UPI0026DD6561|nr:hypothetical protein [Corynebacterium sp.]MDO5097698.1 hypothetical protein [Corynebacterium sp.]